MSSPNLEQFGPLSSENQRLQKRSQNGREISPNFAAIRYDGTLRVYGAGFVIKV